MYKRIIAAFLFFMFVVGICAGCGLTEGSNGKLTIPGTETDENGNISDAPTVRDFDGYKYRMYGQGFSVGATIVVEELSTDVVDNAMYRRNEKVKDIYNINIDAQEKGDAYKLAADYSGEDLVDVFYVPERMHYQNCAEYAVNLLDVPTLRLYREYWNQEHNRVLTVDGVLQTAVGNIYASEELCLSTLILNNKLFEENGNDVSEFQKRVIDGKWYYEDFYKYVKQGTRDIDGIPGMTSSDIYGLLTGWDIYWQLYNSAGLSVIEQNVDGEYEFTISSEETLSAFNVFKDITANAAMCQFGEEWGGVRNFEGMYTSFTRDHGLFATMRIYDINTLRNMKSDYTILPMPKLYESLDRYYTVADGYNSVIWIPKTVSSVSRTGLITEALAYYSDEYQSNLYDKVLMEKYARDNVSQKLLEIIFSNIRWQIDEEINIMDFRQSICHVWAKGRQGVEGFASTTRNNISRATENLNTMINQIKDSKNNIDDKNI